MKSKFFAFIAIGVFTMNFAHAQTLTAEQFASYQKGRLEQQLNYDSKYLPKNFVVKTYILTLEKGGRGDRNPFLVTSDLHDKNIPYKTLRNGSKNPQIQIVLAEANRFVNDGNDFISISEMENFLRGRGTLEEIPENDFTKQVKSSLKLEIMRVDVENTRRPHSSASAIGNELLNRAMVGLTEVGYQNTGNDGAMARYTISLFGTPKQMKAIHDYLDENKKEITFRGSNVYSIEETNLKVIGYQASICAALFGS